MEDTLCISSIPNSSSSLCYGEREGGEEGERMERRVRKAPRGGGGENVVTDRGVMVYDVDKTTEIRWRRCRCIA